MSTSVRDHAPAVGPLLVSVGLLLLWIWRYDELSGALSGQPLGLCVAAWSSVAMLVGAWIQFWRRRYRRGRSAATSPGRQLVARVSARRISRLALQGCGMYVGLALLAPALAPHDPNRIGDGVATHSLPPLSRIHVVLKRDGGQIAGNEIELHGETIRIRRGVAWTVIDRSELVGIRPDDWHRRRWHILGTDHLGRDLLSRLIVGSQVSLGVGLLAALLAVTLGAVVGGMAGWAGPRVDGLLMRFTDAMLAFPRIFLILMVLTVLPGSFGAVVVVLALTGWMGPCRLVRAEVLSLRQREFVQAARVAGRRGSSIVARHLLPNALSPLLVAAALRVGDTMLLEAGLSFLGLGVPPPHATWGNIVSGGRPALVEAWWISTFPGLAIVGAVLAFNVLGDGIRRALAPR